MKKIMKEIIAEINPFDDFDTNTDLLGEGILDSLTLMLFVKKLEEKMNIKICEDDITIENFYSIETIEDFLNKRE